MLNHHGFQGWPVSWTCCGLSKFVTPCDPALKGADPEVPSVPPEQMTDEQKRKAAVDAAR